MLSVLKLHFQFHVSSLCLISDILYYVFFKKLINLYKHVLTIEWTNQIYVLSNTIYKWIFQFVKILLFHRNLNHHKFTYNNSNPLKKIYTFLCFLRKKYFSFLYFYGNYIWFIEGYKMESVLKTTFDCFYFSKTRILRIKEKHYWHISFEIYWRNIYIRNKHVRRNFLNEVISSLEYKTFWQISMWFWDE